MASPTFRWSFSAYNKHQHSLGWYICAGIVLALFLVYALSDGNFLFATILVLAGIIFLFYDHTEPPQKKCVVSSKGIKIDDTLIQYSQLSKFWLIYEPPRTKNLYLDFTSGLKPRITIPLEDQNPIAIREFLLKFAEEDLERQAEPITEQLGRLLKL